jgi:hypothetical protein
MARVMLAAKRTSKAMAQQQAPAELDLVELLPAGSTPQAAAGEAAGDQGQTTPAAAPSTGAELGSSGLDMGTVMQGGDSFDALTKGISNA